MSSSVPDFSLEARRCLDEARKILLPDPSPWDERLVPKQPDPQALETVGLGYGVLAVRQH